MPNFDPLRFSRHAAENDEYRRELIAALAYSIAEKRHFAPGSAVDDWLQAEAEVDRAFAQRRHAQLKDIGQ